MRTLALDYGETRIGVAMTDPTRTFAQPLETIQRGRRGREPGIARIVEIVRENQVDCIVIGLPLHLDGGQGEQVERTRVFGEKVARATGQKVEYLDERLSSVEAQRVLTDAGVSAKKQRGRIDPIAAAILLQTWLARTSR